MPDDAPVKKTFIGHRRRKSRWTCGVVDQLLERSLRAFATSSSIAAGSCACEPTLSDPVTNLPSTTTVGTDWTSNVCACCFARFILPDIANRSEEHTSELQSHSDLVCRLLLE